MRAITVICATLAVMGFAGCSSSSEDELAICPVDQQCPLQATQTKQRHSYEAWVAEWWRWSAKIPNAENPVKDPDGSKCAVGQPKSSSDFGSAWFLCGVDEGAASPTKRSCSLPDDRGILFPILGSYCVSCRDGEDCEAQGKPAGCKGDPQTEEYVRSCLEGLIPDAVTEIAATIDDKPVEGLLESFQVSTEKLFTIEGPEKAEDRPYICTYPAREVFSDGIWVFIEPLAAGKHTLSFSVDTSIGFSLAVQYTLDVQSADAFYEDHPDLD